MDLVMQVTSERERVNKLVFTSIVFWLNLKSSFDIAFLREKLLFWSFIDMPHIYRVSLSLTSTNDSNDQ
jgi:hypothetical protein